MRTTLFRPSWARPGAARAAPWLLLVALALLGVASPPAQADLIAISTFDTGDDGWIAVDLPNSLGNPPPVLATYSLTYNASGGNPGGFVSMTDVTGDWVMFSAPAAFLGNKSAAFGGAIVFDLQSDFGGIDGYPAVTLVGDGMALYYPTTAPATTWTAYGIQLLPTGWKLGDYVAGPEPTAAEMQGVLSNLTALYINSDWTFGVETSGLDNVVMAGHMAAVPEPGSLTLASLGSLGLVVTWYRRRAARGAAVPARTACPSTLL